MGMYDTVFGINETEYLQDATSDYGVDIKQSGQVKIWDCGLDIYFIGDTVPHILDGTYSVKMVEGGYLNIKDNVLISWIDEPQFDLVIDKWGNLSY